MTQQDTPPPQPVESPQPVKSRTLLVAAFATIVPCLLHVAYGFANGFAMNGFDLVGGLVDLMYLSAIVATGVLALVTLIECARKGFGSQRGLVVMALAAAVLHATYGFVVLPRLTADPAAVESSSARYTPQQPN
jgi:hypothetical protein